MTERLAGKVALITGAAGGIGGATARLFCAEGAAVALVDLSEDACQQVAAEVDRAVPGARLLSLQADIADVTQVADAVAAAIAHFGALHVLVNNAAIREYSAVADSTPDSWQRLFAVNLFGAVNFTRAALPALRCVSGASIVNVASTFAVVGRRGMGQYDATKAGLLSLTRTVAVEEAENGIRVNAVCPGSTWTPYIAGRAAARGVTEEELRQSGAVQSLLKRWATADEIAYPILFLASDEASFITGTTLMVDGGISTL